MRQQCVKFFARSILYGCLALSVNALGFQHATPPIHRGGTAPPSLLAGRVGARNSQHWATDAQISVHRHSALEPLMSYYKVMLNSEQWIYFSTLAKIVQAETAGEGVISSQDLNVRLQLSGTLTISVVKETPNSRLLAYRVVPTVLTLTMNGATASKPETQALEEELQKATLYAEVDTHGKIQKIWLHQAKEFSQGVLRTIAALMQTTLPPKDALYWEIAEESPEGVYLALYTVRERKAGVWRLQKQRTHYTEVQPGLFPFPYEIRPQGDLQIDYDSNHRLVRKMQGRVQLASTARGQTIGRVKIECEVQQTQIKRLGENEQKQLLTQYHSIEHEAQPLRITEANAGKPDEAHIAKLELGNETYASLKKRWGQLSDQASFTEVTDLSRKWRALLILNPQLIASTEQELKMLAFNTAKAQVLISALMQSQRPEAQQALCRLADHFLKRANHDAYNHYVACLALLESPHPSVLQWLTAKARSASSEVAYPALLALGAVGRTTSQARQMQARDSAYKTILDRLNKAQSDQEMEVCLLALGNLGHPDSLSVLETFLSHENERLRAVATSSLRFIEMPAAERLLVRMLRDSSREVRLQAIEAFNHRRISQAILTELEQYLREEPQKDLRRALIDALWLQRNKVNGIRPIIAQAATGDPDEEIRLYAQGLLQQKE